MREGLRQHHHLPVATYRLQLNANFPFGQAQRLVPYLHALGISDCYTSPYLKARPGSTSGYDIIDAQRLNPEIGTETDYAAFVQALQQHGMGQLMDIVPNHMGVIGGENAWWQDVLEHGPASSYARFFDIDWHASKDALQNKVLLPILGKVYGEVLEKQELRLTFEEGAFEVHYYEHRLPIALDTTMPVLQACLPGLQHRLGERHQQRLELQSIIKALRRVPRPTEHDPERVAERYREMAITRQRLATLYATCQVFRMTLPQTLQVFNGTKGKPRSFDRLHALLEAQSYRLSFWRVASNELNYRRFFDISHLAGVRVEDPVVFEATHAFILQLLEEGKVTGVRIDHPDGLFDPLGYFQRLQQAYVLRYCRRLLATRQVEAGTDDDTDAETLAARFVAQYSSQLSTSEARPLYVVVEKILQANENLPQDWPVHGTTGYDFLNQLNGLFVDGANARTFHELYTGFVGEPTTYADILYTAKKLIMQTSLASELETLGEQLVHLAETNWYWRDFPRTLLTEALQEAIACFPVYRTYIRSGNDQVSPSDHQVINTAVNLARSRNSMIDPAVFEMLHTILLLCASESSSEADRQAQRLFVQKFQQLTGPVMAKGLEDTALYRYTPLISLNDVGGDPDQFGIPVEAFHQRNAARQRHWPYTLLATSTHDTKRSEDVRARLNVLSEIPQRWRDCLWRWHHLNQRHKPQVNGQPAPSCQEEYLLYQTLLGAWPLESCTAEDMASFGERIQAYMRKALREAKVHTTWIDPHHAYETAVDRFIEALLDESLSATFLEDFRTLQQVVAHHGMWNALAQTLLKIAAPGVPDIYQGCELWDFSLVDPDNRRPVDYAHRQAILQALQQRCQGTAAERLELVRELLRTRHDGRIKLYVIWQALTLRRARAQVFLEGDYLPLEVQGSKREHLCAFARVYGDEVVVVLAPRLLTRLLPQVHDVPLGQAVWGESHVVLPETLAGSAYGQLFTGETITPARINDQTVLSLATVFATFPIAMLQRLDR
jgi:(1->4)-alpha-D-glucan 1-alpha-D-glucosylmutase